MGDWALRPDPDQPGQFKWMYDKDAPSPGQNPAVTTMLPVVGPSEPARGGDVGDWIDPNAPDPTEDEVTDRDDPNYVDPWFGA
jgi:hypothetical protein